MNQNADEKKDSRNIGIRGMYMLLMLLAVHLCGTVLFIVAAMQFVLLLINGEPNARLITFGRSLGRYLQQSTNYLTFVSEELPFPFCDWPSGY